ncbi:sigma factor-like helix-turn-helix DNA-binding protein [Microcoleus sp. herbarium14]|uniref:sigma factor-like helix-turn-helix DNA-binding protein n=1 Tax=Microcoleus sp. herbarium14 TaxID=3055439 RepID=UPI0034E01FFA
MERLSPIERAVFLLRDVFEYEYDEIGQTIGKSPTNCRQILRRAPAASCRPTSSFPSFQTAARADYSPIFRCLHQGRFARLVAVTGEGCDVLFRWWRQSDCSHQADTRGNESSSNAKLFVANGCLMLYLA